MNETKIKKYEKLEEKCTIKEKYGKCMIPLSSAFFCLDCYTIHIRTQCPNCYSYRQVRLIELFLSTYDEADPTIEKVIKKFMEK